MKRYRVLVGCEHEWFQVEAESEADVIDAALDEFVPELTVIDVECPEEMGY